MQESKFQVTHWKKWKAISLLLKQTKDELSNNIKGISYDDSLPGGSHKTIFEKYNRLIENLEIYDDHIKVYDFMIKRLENAINELLNEKQREAIIIYANFPNKGDSDKRENKALEKGYSRTYYYKILNESFDILDAALSTIKDNNEIVD